MRTKNSILNMKSNFLILITQTILSFVVRTIFIQMLGKSYLGLDGLFTNILNILSIAELGISSAVSFNLYKPLKEQDTKKINSLMAFYKKFYYLIGIIMTVVGLLIIPFLRFMITDASIENMYIIYVLYLLNTTIMYFISYKEILILADQKNYKLTLINFIFTVVMYGLQLLVLIKFSSFILYLVVQLITKAIQKIWINHYITKNYSNINFNTKDSLDKKELTTINKNIKSLFFNKIGDLCIFCTDNILISKLVNLVSVGIYSNYASIITITRSIINSIFNGITASFGNFAIDSNEEGQQTVFEIMDFIRFILYGIFSVGFFLLINTFIEIWLGKTFILSDMCVLVICLNFYLMGTQVSIEVLKQAKGFYEKDRFVSIIQAIINLTLSIVLGIKIGIVGILVSTAISYIILPCWIRPYLIYKHIFKKTAFKYFKRELLNIITIIFISSISLFLFNYINISNIFIKFIVETVLVTCVYIIIVTIVYFRSNEFQYLYNNFIKKK